MMNALEIIKEQRKTICKGCYTYENRAAFCGIVPIIHKGTDKELTCSCSICLVKGVCESSCDLIDCFYKSDTDLKEDKSLSTSRGLVND